MLEFSTKYLPLWFQGRLWTFTTTTLFLGIFLEKSAQSTPQRAQSGKNTGLQSDRLEFEPFLLSFTDHVSLSLLICKR